VPCAKGSKEFSDWPTIPSVYVKGEFCWRLCIIIREMMLSGELVQRWKKNGVG